MHHSDIINRVISGMGYSTYLEIGVRDPSRNFNLINCETKHGVDPAPRGTCTFVMTSDMFFDTVGRGNRYDIIFIDGLHLCAQVLRDLDNSLRCLGDNGTIMMHDCNPESEAMQVEHHTRGPWNGTVWKAFALLRSTRSDLHMVTLNCCTGLGLVCRGSQKLFTALPNNPSYAFLDKHRAELLQLIPAAELDNYLRERMGGREHA